MPDTRYPFYFDQGLDGDVSIGLGMARHMLTSTCGRIRPRLTEPGAAMVATALRDICARLDELHRGLRSVEAVPKEEPILLPHRVQ